MVPTDYQFEPIDYFLLPTTGSNNQTTWPTCNGWFECLLLLSKMRSTDFRSNWEKLVKTNFDAALKTADPRYQFDPFHPTQAQHLMDTDSLWENAKAVAGLKEIKHFSNSSLRDFLAYSLKQYGPVMVQMKPPYELAPTIEKLGFVLVTTIKKTEKEDLQHRRYSADDIDEDSELTVGYIDPRSGRFIKKNEDLHKFEYCVQESRNSYVVSRAKKYMPEPPKPEKYQSTR